MEVLAAKIRNNNDVTGREIETTHTQNKENTKMKHFADDATLILEDKQNINDAINTVNQLFEEFSGHKQKFQRYEGTCLGSVGKDVGEQNNILIIEKERERERERERELSLIHI